jgi:hypothetical protein
MRKIHRTRDKKGENEKHEKRKCKGKEGSVTERNKRDRRVKKTRYKNGHESKEEIEKLWEEGYVKLGDEIRDLNKEGLKGDRRKLKQGKLNRKEEVRRKK